MTAESVDIAAIGYGEVREAFNETLQLCVEKLAKADWALAHEMLGSAILDEDTPGWGEMLADAALYSRKRQPGTRGGARRPIDRIAPKLAVKRDPLKSLIAARLPAAIFSIFAITEVHEQGGVLARDLLDDSRTLHVMDKALAAQFSRHGQILMAGRFVNLGPWHLGFGIVLPLRKSEVLAIRLALSYEGELEARRDDLHELLYPAHLHGEDAIMTALQPLIASIALAIDTEMINIDDLAVPLWSLLADEPARTSFLFK